MRICIFGNRNNTLLLIKFLVEKFPEVSLDLVTLAPENSSVETISGFSYELHSEAKMFVKDVIIIDDYKLRDQKFLKRIKQTRYDLGLAIGWQRLIPESVLSEFKLGVFGWHGSCFALPNGRGRSPLNWSIRLGASEIYLNLFRYSPGIDDGEIYETYPIKISGEDYISDLQLKVLNKSIMSAGNLIKELLLGSISLQKQVDHPFIMFPKLSESTGELFPNRMRAIDAHRIIRSCSKPFPGAFVVDQKLGKVRIWKAKLTKNSDNNAYSVRINDGLLIVAFVDGYILSDEYEIES